MVPALVVFTPRRWLVPILVAAAAAALCLRTAVYGFGFANEMAALALLPGQMDILACGLLAAVVMQAGTVPVGAPDPRVAPRPGGGPRRRPRPVRDQPQPVRRARARSSSRRGAPHSCSVSSCGRRKPAGFKSGTLEFFGNNGYCLYLSHLPVLGLMHGVILGTRPDLATPAQWLVTVAALPVCVLVGWGMTRLIEEPLTRYGRTWRWSAEVRAPASATAVAA